jgi:DNA polymerase/3'-5' exonuclease PolX
MSTSTTKRPHAVALADAESLRSLFPPTTYARWEFAGSVRRGKPEVSDVEHVVIPNFGDMPGGGLFADRVNLLFHRLDELERKGTVTKHVYGNSPTGAPSYRWGDKYRGVDFRGFNHEFFTADAQNWGAVLLIRTGPARFSQQFVDRFNLRGMYRQHLGYLRRVKHPALHRDDESDTDGEIIPVPDEETYFRMAEMEFVKPEDRR